MKRIYLFLFAAAFGLSSLSAQTTCVADATKSYFTNNNGWSDSEWYKILDIDAATLGGKGIQAHSGTDGAKTSANFNTGSFTSPVLAWNETTSSYDVTTINWPVDYYMTCLADTFHNSAWTKINMLGSTVTGNGTNDIACYWNNNSVVPMQAFNKVGFLEFSRLAQDATNAPGVSRHGYLQINNLPQVERVQWSFSSTAWKRGVKLDIKYGTGEWQPLQWEPSDISNSVTSFSEQGYNFENIIGKQEDPTSKISLRWRIWDGDTIHQNPTQAEGVLYNVKVDPLAQKQVARIHQIKIFSGVIPTEAPNALIANKSEFKIYKQGNQIVSTEEGRFSVYTPEGKLVKTALGNKVDISNLNRGIYIVKLNSNSGLSKVEKVIL